MRHVFLAFTNPEAGVEATFNAWYDRHHVPEVLKYGRGFTGCQRFRLVREVRRGELHAWAYLALYGLELDDLALLARSPWIEKSPPLTPFAGLLKSDHVAWVYTPEGERVSSAEGRALERTAPHLLLRWHAQAPPDAHQLESVVNGSAGCLSARSYRLASDQRANQRSSPWNGLVIYELKSPDNLPIDTAGPAWLYTAVSDFRSRE